jgi:hypothetical protein
VYLGQHLAALLVLLSYLVVGDFVVGNLVHLTERLLVCFLGPVDKVDILHDEVIMVESSNALRAGVEVGVVHKNILAIIYNSFLIYSIN